MSLTTLLLFLFSLIHHSFGFKGLNATRLNSSGHTVRMPDKAQATVTIMAISLSVFRIMKRNMSWPFHIVFIVHCTWSCMFQNIFNKSVVNSITKIKKK
jgi:hypothetical protein